jgi:urease accessory protein
MLRATAIVRRSAVSTETVVDRLTLAYDQRHRRRIAMTADGGLSFLLDLETATVLDDGDAVRLDDGRLVQVKAAPENLIEIRAESPLLLKKIIWHLGNRHVPAEIADDAVYIAEDHVLTEMVRGLGATAAPIQRSFSPERGAYDDGHEHGH